MCAKAGEECYTTASVLCQLLIYLIGCGQLLAVGSEGDEAGGQVNQAADFQVGAGAIGGRRADCFRSAHHVAVTPLNAAAKQAQCELSTDRYKFM